MQYRNFIRSSPESRIAFHFMDAAQFDTSCLTFCDGQNMSLYKAAAVLRQTLFQGSIFWTPLMKCSCRYKPHETLRLSVEDSKWLVSNIGEAQILEWGLSQFRIFRRWDNKKLKPLQVYKYPSGTSIKHKIIQNLCFKTRISFHSTG